MVHRPWPITQEQGLLPVTFNLSSGFNTSFVEKSPPLKRWARVAMPAAVIVRVAAVFSALIQFSRQSVTNDDSQ